MSRENLIHKKITISGYGYEYIRGYVDGAGNMISSDLIEFVESITVSIFLVLYN